MEETRPAASEGGGRALSKAGASKKAGALKKRAREKRRAPQAFADLQGALLRPVYFKKRAHLSCARRKTAVFSFGCF